MAKKSNSQYAKALYEVTEDLKEDQLDEVLQAFVKILVKDHRLKQANNIIVEFEKYAKEQAGIKEIKITSARELDGSLVEKIKVAFGDKVEEVTSVDESLIGGLKVRVGDKILDGSVKTQLVRLRRSIS